MFGSSNRRILIIISVSGICRRFISILISVDLWNAATFNTPRSLTGIEHIVMSQTLFLSFESFSLVGIISSSLFILVDWPSSTSCWSWAQNVIKIILISFIFLIIWQLLTPHDSSGLIIWIIVLSSPLRFIDAFGPGILIITFFGKFIASLIFLRWSKWILFFILINKIADSKGYFLIRFACISSTFIIFIITLWWYHTSPWNTILFWTLSLVNRHLFKTRLLHFQVLNHFIFFL